MPCLMRNGLNYTGGGGDGSVLPPETKANIVELTLEEYDALGDEKNSDDTLYLIKDGIPSALNNCVLLWENPDPTAEFPAQDITLASDDYDILEVYFFQGTYIKANQILAGQSCRLVFSTIGVVDNATGVVIIQREFSYVSKTKYHVYQAIDSRGGTSAPTGARPYKIYGYKISGKYPSSVDQTPSQNNIFSYEETRIGTWVDGKPLYRKILSGKLVNSSECQFATGVQNVDTGYVNIGNSFLRNQDVPTSPFFSFCNPTNLDNVWFNPETNVVSVRSFTDLTPYTAFVCFEYTKTTDIAGG